MTAARPSAHDVMTSAAWLAHRYDPGHDAVHMLPVARERHAAVPFLTDEYLGGDAEPMVLRRSDATALAPQPGPVHFIFHSAYCCSTLLAAAFDIPGKSMGLKEPVLLNDLVGWRYRGAKGPDVARVLDEGVRLLARPFAPGEATVIKPSNIVNPLIPALMGLNPQARALFLHAPLDAYLASIARKGMWGRLWVRDLFGKLIREGLIAPLGIAPDHYIGLTDIQVAAAGWLAQHHLFQSLAGNFGNRVATLNSEMLMAHPADAFAALAAHFGLQLAPAQVQAIVTGPVFARDAKNGADFAPGQRAQAASKGRELHGEEIDKVLAWAEAVASGSGIDMRLPQGLLG